MSTPIQRRFSVTTNIRDAVAGTQDLSTPALVVTSPLVGGVRYTTLDIFNWNTVFKDSNSIEFKWLEAVFGQTFKPKRVLVIHWDKASGTETVQDALNNAVDLGAKWYFTCYEGTDGTDETFATQTALSNWVESSAQRLQCLLLTKDEETALSSLSSSVFKLKMEGFPDVDMSSLSRSARLVPLIRPNDYVEFEYRDVDICSMGFSSVFNNVRADFGFKKDGWLIYTEDVEGSPSYTISGQGVVRCQREGDKILLFDMNGTEATLRHTYTNVPETDLIFQVSLFDQSSSTRDLTVEKINVNGQEVGFTEIGEWLGGDSVVARGLHLRQTGMSRTTVIYHPTALKTVQGTVDISKERPDGAVLGRLASTDEGAVQWSYNNLSFVSDSGLTVGQQTSLVDKGYGFIETFGNTSFTHIYPGKTVTGREIRIQWGADWHDVNVESTIATFAFNYDLMAYDLETFTSIEGILREWKDRALARRIIVDTLARPATITLPDPDTLSALVRASGSADFSNVYDYGLNTAITDWTLTGNWRISL